MKGPRGPRLVAAAVAFALAAAVAMADARPAEIEACIRSYTATSAIPPGVEHCADLFASLGVEQLEDGEESAASGAFNPSHLEDLEELASRYGGAPVRAAPDADLDAILRALPPFEQEPPLSLWQRFVAWVEELFAEPEPGDAPDWLVRLLDGIRIPETLAARLLDAAVIGLLLIAAAVVVNELRQSGLFGRRRGAAARASGSVPAVAVAASLADLERASARDKPRLLLALIVERLRAGGAVIRASHTPREVYVLAPAFDAAQRQDLIAICDAAERAAYGGWRPRGDEVEPIVARGVALLAAMRTGAGA